MRHRYVYGATDINESLSNHDQANPDVMSKPLSLKIDIDMVILVSLCQILDSTILGMKSLSNRQQLYMRATTAT